MIKFFIKNIFILLFFSGSFLFSAQTAGERLLGAIRRLEPRIDSFLAKKSIDLNALNELWTGPFVGDLILYNEGFTKGLKVKNLDQFDAKLKDFFPYAFGYKSFPSKTTPERANFSRTIGRLMEKNTAFNRFFHNNECLDLLKRLNLEIPQLINLFHIEERHMHSPSSESSPSIVASPVIHVTSPIGVMGGEKTYKKQQKFSVTELKSIFPENYNLEDIFRIIESGKDYKTLTPEKFELIAVDDHPFYSKHIVKHLPTGLFIEFLTGGEKIVRSAYPVIHYEDISLKHLGHEVLLDWDILLDNGRFHIPLSKNGILDYLHRNPGFEILYVDRDNTDLVIVDISPVIEEKNPDLKGKVPPVLVKIDKKEIKPRNTILQSPLKRLICARTPRGDVQCAEQVAGPSPVSLALTLTAKD